MNCCQDILCLNAILYLQLIIFLKWIWPGYFPAWSLWWFPIDNRIETELVNLEYSLSVGPHSTFQASSSTSHFIHIGLCTLFEHTMSLCLNSFAQSIPLSNTSYTSTPCPEKKKKKPNHITKANLIITSFVKTSLAPHHHRGVSQPLICAS